MQSTRLVTRGFGLVLATSLFTGLGFQLLGAALPNYAVALGASDVQLGLIVGLFALMAMIGRPVVGWLLDQGSKPLVLASGAVLYTLCSAGYGLVASMTPLLGLRVLNGLAMAATMTAAQALTTDLTPPRRRGEALALQGFAGTLSMGLGPVMGVAIAGLAGYGSLFWVAAACCLLAVPCALLVPRPPSSGPRPPARLFNATVNRPGLMVLATMLAFGAVVGLVPVHATRTGLENAGLFFTAFAVGVGLAQIAGGRLTDRRGRAAAILPGLGLAALGLWAVAMTGGWWLLPAGLVFGVGQGLAQTGLFALTADYVPPEQRGSAMATAGTYLELGIGGGATLAGLISQIAGIPTAFLLLGAVPAVALAMGLASPWGRAALTPPRLSERPADSH